MTILAVSPHLDDAVFSAGGALATAAAAGFEVIVATAFTQSVPDPTGFALLCQTDKGVGPETDYMALRRQEDADACARIGAEAVWLDLPEAPHRGYGSAGALFGDVRGADADTWRAVCDRLAPLIADRQPDVVLSCQGLGGHVDHRHVVRAVREASRDVPDVVSWWRDVPYALRDPSAQADGDLDGLRPVGLPLAVEALTVKLDACAAYASQLGYQFGRDDDRDPVDAMRRRLAEFAHAEGARYGFVAPAESFATGSAQAWQELWQVARA